MTATAVSIDRHDPRLRAAAALALTGVVFAGAIFGFFYAWVCSTMWGLDDADPRTAIEAMQAMNCTVRNVVFAPAFFGTPVVLAAAAALAVRAGRRAAAGWLGVAALVYLLGGLVLTLAVNVPMNDELATESFDVRVEQARAVWADYSGRWQRWNLARTVASGISLLLAGIGLRVLSREQAGERVR